MRPESILPDALDLAKPGSFCKNTLDSRFPVLLYFRRVDRSARRFSRKMPSNPTQSTEKPSLGSQ